MEREHSSQSKEPPQQAAKVENGGATQKPDQEEDPILENDSFQSLREIRDADFGSEGEEPVLGSQIPNLRTANNGGEPSADSQFQIEEDTMIVNNEVTPQGLSKEPLQSSSPAQQQQASNLSSTTARLKQLRRQQNYNRTNNANHVQSSGGVGQLNLNSGRQHSRQPLQNEGTVIENTEQFKDFMENEEDAAKLKRQDKAVLGQFPADSSTRNLLESHINSRNYSNGISEEVRDQAQQSKQIQFNLNTQPDEEEIKTGFGDCNEGAQQMNSEYFDQPINPQDFQQPGQETQEGGPQAMNNPTNIMSKRRLKQTGNGHPGANLREQQQQQQQQSFGALPNPIAKRPLQMAPIMKAVDSKQGGFSNLNLAKNFTDNSQMATDQLASKMPAISANTGSKSTLSNISPHLRPKLKGSQNDFGSNPTTNGILSISGDNSTTTLKLTGGVKFSGEDQPYLPQQTKYDQAKIFSSSDEGNSPFPTNKYKKLAQVDGVGSSQTPLKIQIQKSKNPQADNSYFANNGSAAIGERGNDRLETQNSSFDQTDALPSQPLVNDRISQNQVPSFGQPMVHQQLAAQQQELEHQQQEAMYTQGMAQDAQYQDYGPVSGEAIFDQQYTNEVEPQRVGRFVHLKNNDPTKFQNIAKGSNRLQQKLSKNLHSITDNRPMMDSSSYVPEITQAQQVVPDLQNQSFMKNSDLITALPQASQAQSFASPPPFETTEDTSAPALKGPTQNNRAMALVQNLQMQSQYLSSQEQQIKAARSVDPAGGEFVGKNERQQMLLSEIDKEVQEVNNKTQLKAMGRTGRFSQIVPSSQVNEETASVDGNGGIIDPIYSKKLNMTAKQPRGGKLKSLVDPSSATKDDLHLSTTAGLPQPGNPLSPKQEEIINQMNTTGVNPGRPKTSRSRPSSSYMIKNKKLLQDQNLQFQAQFADSTAVIGSLNENPSGIQTGIPSGIQSGERTSSQHQNHLINIIDNSQIGQLDQLAERERVYNENGIVRINQGSTQKIPPIDGGGSRINISKKQSLTSIRKRVIQNSQEAAAVRASKFRLPEEEDTSTMVFHEEKTGVSRLQDQRVFDAKIAFDGSPAGLGTSGNNPEPSHFQQHQMMEASGGDAPPQPMGRMRIKLQSHREATGSGSKMQEEMKRFENQMDYQGDDSNVQSQVQSLKKIKLLKNQVKVMKQSSGEAHPNKENSLDSANGLPVPKAPQPISSDKVIVINSQKINFVGAAAGNLKPIQSQQVQNPANSLDGHNEAKINLINASNAQAHQAPSENKPMKIKLGQINFSDNFKRQQQSSDPQPSAPPKQ